MNNIIKRMDTIISISKEKERQNNFLEETKIKEQLNDNKNRVQLLESNIYRLNTKIKNSRIGLGLVSVCTIGLIINNVCSKSK